MTHQGHTAREPCSPGDTLAGKNGWQDSPRRQSRLPFRCPTTPQSPAQSRNQFRNCPGGPEPHLPRPGELAPGIAPTSQSGSLPASPPQGHQPPRHLHFCPSTAHLEPRYLPSLSWAPCMLCPGCAPTCGKGPPVLRGKARPLLSPSAGFPEGAACLGRSGVLTSL